MVFFIDGFLNVFVSFGRKMNSATLFTFNFKDILIEEVALEGLEGITLELLWKRIEKRISRSLTKLIYSRFWFFALQNEEISLFELPEPRQTIEIINRNDIVCEAGLLRDPPDYLDGPYEYCPVADDHGSCKDYATRQAIPKDELINSSFDSVVSKYGNRLVLVASMKERWRALVPHLPEKNLIDVLSPINYCILELIGKSRENGQASIGKSNLLKVLNNAQLFYTRRLLCKLDLIVQVKVYVKIVGNKYMKPYILKLKRFHSPALFETPQKGLLVELIAHLKTKPSFTDSVENLKKQNVPLPNYGKNTKIYATIFKRDFAPKPDEAEPAKKKIRKSLLPDEVIRLNIGSDSESESDTENEEVSKPCDNMVGVNLYRQAYELILNAGSRGLSAVEFRQGLGVGFYSGRNILKWFRSKNIVTEYFEERGRQRLGRYAIGTSVTILDDLKHEKDRLLQYFMETSVKAENESFDEPSTSATPSASKDDCSDSLNRTVESCDTSCEFQANISQVDINEKGSAYKDLIETKNKISMRQLKFANAILKITREKRIITGFRTLNTLAANEVNESPMDNKKFTKFLHSLAKDCQIKIYNLKWPNIHSKQPRSTLIICAPDVKVDDPVIKAKYNEICFRSNIRTKSVDDSKQSLSLATKEQGQDTKGSKTSKRGKPYSREASLDKIERGQHMSLSLQRYRRIQKLHEFIFDLVYGGHLETTNTNSPGYVTMANLIPQMPVRLVLGHFSKMSLLKFDNIAIKADMLDMKLKDTLPVLQTVLSSKVFLATVFDTINILATFGLVQICKPMQIIEDHHTGSFRYIFYVNRNTSIIDTRGDWPRQDVDLENLKRSFRLETQQDVNNYWLTVYEIAMNTKVARHTKKRSLPAVKVRPEREAPKHEGQIYGDGDGPCGFDSFYYLDQQKHWEVMSTEILNKDNVKFLPRPQKAQTTAIKKRPPKKRPATLKTKVHKKVTRNRTLKAEREPLVKWSNWEDNILTLVKTALVILSPNALTGSTAIRNTVTKLLMNNPAKSGGVCHKRLVTLENQVAVSIKSECLLKEIRRHKYLISKYEDLFTALRIKHRNFESNYIREAELVTLELVFLLYKISKSETFLKRCTHCVASNLQDFYSKFEIKTASDNKPYTMYHLNESLAPEVQALREAVLMAMTSVEDMEVPLETTLKIFNCLSTYDDSYLRDAVDQLRHSGVIATKEKYLRQQLSNFTFQDLIRITTSYMKAMSAFRLSAVYRRRQFGRLNSSFCDDLADTLKHADLSGKYRGSPEINCVCFELQASNAIDILTVTAPRVVEISLDGSSMDEDKSSEEPTKSVVKPGYAELKKKVPVTSFTELFDAIDFDILFEALIQINIVKQATDDPPKTDKIINFLKVAGKDGATFKDLQKIWTSDTKSLIRKLERLEKENFITHVGFMENIIVLSKFAHLWCIKIEDISLIPCPWLTGDLVINKHFFMKWCGTIANKVFEYPGIAISRLVSEHCDVLAPRYAQQCCEFLQALKCVNLNYVNIKCLNLFSEDDSTFDLMEYCKYGATDQIVIFPVTNMLTKFSYYKSLILAVK